MKQPLLAAKIIALITCVVSTIYACKSESYINARIKKEHTILVREGMTNIIQELHNSYLNGFLWEFVIAILAVVGFLLTIELVLNWYVNSKKEELKAITDDR